MKKPSICPSIKPSSFLLALVLLLLPALASAEMFYFVAVSFNQYGQSTYSVEVSSDLPEGAEGFTLSWDPVETASGYRVHGGRASKVYDMTFEAGSQTTIEIRRADLYRVKPVSLTIIVNQ